MCDYVKVSYLYLNLTITLNSIIIGNYTPLTHAAQPECVFSEQRPFSPNRLATKTAPPIMTAASVFSKWPDLFFLVLKGRGHCSPVHCLRQHQVVAKCLWAYGLRRLGRTGGP